MATARKRLTLDIDESLQRRLKAAAALKGISLREFCATILEDTLDRERGQYESDDSPAEESFEAFIRRNREITGGKKFPGNSADIIREGRELRTEQIENRIK